MDERRNIALFAPATDVQEWEALREPLLNGHLISGTKVEAFEREFARKHRVRYAIATNNGTSSLHLILVALGIQPGDEVIISAFSWVSAMNVVLYCGATPVLVDINPDTFNLDIQEVANQIGKRTKAIIVSHAFGLCADLKAIAALAPEVPIIEDATCGIGSQYGYNYAGSIGIAGAFSFHSRQIITTGDGGMVTTNDDQIAEKIMALRNHGASLSAAQQKLGPKPYLAPSFNLLGFDYLLSDLQGAIGLIQLQKLDDLLSFRQYWAEYYYQQLKDLPWLKLPRAPEGYTHSWQKYVCCINEEISPLSRNQIMEFLQVQGISTRPANLAIHTLTYNQIRFGFEEADYPIARDCALKSLAIPLHNRMSSADFEYVVKKLQQI